MKYNIKHVKDENTLIDLFYFFSKTIYSEDKEKNQNYNIMTDRYNEMKKQFEEDSELLLYMEYKNKIIGGVTIKNRNKKNEARIGLLVVDRSFRNKGLGKILINTIENKCRDQGIKFLSLGSRNNALSFYKKMGYKPQLMVQVYDFDNIDNVKKVNNEYKNYPIINQFQDVAYGVVFLDVEDTFIEDLDYFKRNLDVSSTQFVFTKSLT